MSDKIKASIPNPKTNKDEFINFLITNINRHLDYDQKKYLVKYISLNEKGVYDKTKNS